MMRLRILSHCLWRTHVHGKLPHVPLRSVRLCVVLKSAAVRGARHVVALRGSGECRARAGTARWWGAPDRARSCVHSTIVARYVWLLADALGSVFQDSAKCHSGQSSGHVMLNKTALLATQIRHLNRVRIIIKIPYNTAKHGEPTRF